MGAIQRYSLLDQGNLAWCGVSLDSLETFEVPNDNLSLQVLGAYERQAPTELILAYPKALASCLKAKSELFFSASRSNSVARHIASSVSY